MLRLRVFLRFSTTSVCPFCSTLTARVTNDIYRLHLVVDFASCQCGEYIERDLTQIVNSWAPSFLAAESIVCNSQPLLVTLRGRQRRLSVVFGQSGTFWRADHLPHLHVHFPICLPYLVRFWCQDSAIPAVFADRKTRTKSLRTSKTQHQDIKTCSARGRG